MSIFDPNMAETTKNLLFLRLKVYYNCILWLVTTVLNCSDNSYYVNVLFSEQYAWNAQKLV